MSTQKVLERSEQYSENTFFENRFLAILRATQSGIARVRERNLKAAFWGTIGILTGFHWVCEEGGQWQACTNGPFLLPGLDRSFAPRLECRAGPSG